MTVDSKDPDVNAEYDVDFRDALVLHATRNQNFEANDVLWYPRDTGWYYVVTTAGRTNFSFPESLPRADGETLTDGSAVLTCRHPSSSSLPTLSAVDWTVPTGLSLVSQRQVGMRAFITLSGGTDGVDYDVLCRMTPTIGNVIEKTITIPVRSQ